MFCVLQQTFRAHTIARRRGIAGQSKIFVTNLTGRPTNLYFRPIAFKASVTRILRATSSIPATRTLVVVIVVVAVVGLVQCFLEYHVAWSNLFLDQINQDSVAADAEAFSRRNFLNPSLQNDLPIAQ